VEISLENVRCKTKTQNGISDPFITRTGLRQSDGLSCLLFNITLRKAVSVAELDIRRTILHKSVHILAYVIIGRREEAMKEAFIKPKTAAKQMGLMIICDKTKYMELSNSPTREIDIIINNYNIKNHGI
jgi:sorting nexin-29